MKFKKPIIEKMGEEEVKKILATLEPFAPKGDAKDIYVRRGAYKEEYGWHFPTLDPLKKIRDSVPGSYYGSEKGPVLSIGCGLGFVESLLQKLGVNVIPTDPFLSHGQEELRKDWICLWNYEAHTTIGIMTASQAIEAHPGVKVFLFCWPSYNPDPDWPGEAMEMIVSRMDENTRVIHIGEDEGGCTGSQKFFDLLNQNFSMEDSSLGKNFHGLHDYTQVWGPKEPED
jgi:hypothetical protein